MNANTITKPKLPKTLLEAVRYFSDIDVCVEYVARLRWPHGPVCPSCGGTEHSYLAKRRVWKCRAKDCKRQFSVKVGTIFEQSPIGLDKWLPAVWLLANSKNGVSSHELARALGITQKSAWHVLHRVREALRTGTFDRMTGEVEVDETFIGGKLGNKHAWQRAEFQRTRKSFTDGKTIVVGARERDGGTVRATIVPDRGRADLTGFIREGVKSTDVQVYTDAWKPYRGLTSMGISHAYVDHAEKYVQGRVHTNGIEGFWALLKRGLHGTYVQCDAQHLQRYLDERVFTYNMRKMTDLERFNLALEQSIGRRVTWDELTNA